ncbi:MAG: hypothetical protein INR71_13755 [Terriglobus roseus]|nr:hypothetical protein [Terriglobus roseus]
MHAKPDNRKQTVLAFCVFFASHLLAAAYSPIQDCDEVFNYLEPTHYLNHGYGLQTWEYSPEYALRSWAYAGLHALVVKAGSQLPFVRPKPAEFYLLRTALAFACAFCEAKLFSAVRRAMSGRIALIFLVILSTSTGMFHASVAYLPSSFAMYCTMLAFAAFMDTRRHRVASRARSIFWFGVGGVLGWPFALAMALPFLFEEVFDAVWTGEYVASFKTIVIGSAQAAAVLVGPPCCEVGVQVGNVPPGRAARH